LEITSLNGQFVRVAVTEASCRELLGVVVGFVAAHRTIRVRVFDLTARAMVVVSLESCRHVPPENILHGVQGLTATHPEFGPGEIISERRPRDVLLVQLVSDTGATSGWIPLAQVTITGAAHRANEAQVA